MHLNIFFGFIQSEGTSKSFLVKCSFVEIYNEEVRDLLTKNDKALEVREDPKKGTFVKDLSYSTLSNTKDISKCLDKGNAIRHVKLLLRMINLVEYIHFLLFI